MSVLEALSSSSPPSTQDTFPSEDNLNPTEGEQASIIPKKRKAASSYFDGYDDDDFVVKKKSPSDENGGAGAGVEKKKSKLKLKKSSNSTSSSSSAAAAVVNTSKIAVKYSNEPVESLNGSPAKAEAKKEPHPVIEMLLDTSEDEDAPVKSKKKKVKEAKEDTSLSTRAKRKKPPSKTPAPENSDSDSDSILCDLFATTTSTTAAASPPEIVKEKEKKKEEKKPPSKATNFSTSTTTTAASSPKIVKEKEKKKEKPPPKTTTASPPPTPKIEKSLPPPPPFSSSSSSKPAQNPAPDPAPVVPKLKMKDQILAHLLSTSLPTNLKSLGLALRTTDLVLSNLITPLVERDRLIRRKDFSKDGRGKFIYWYNQGHVSAQVSFSDNPGLKEEVLSAVRDGGVELSGLANKINAKVEEIKTIKSSLLNSEIEGMIEGLNEEVDGLKNRVTSCSLPKSSASSSSKNNVAPPSPNYLRAQTEHYTKEWKKGRTKVMDFVEMFSENVEKSKKDCIVLLNIEKDEEVKVEVKKGGLVSKGRK